MWRTKRSFKIIYKEIKKIFYNKEICLGILKERNTIDFIKVKNDKINIENIPLKESLCSLLLKEKDYANYSDKEIKEIQKQKILNLMPKLQNHGWEHPYITTIKNMES